MFQFVWIFFVILFQTLSSVSFAEEWWQKIEKEWKSSVLTVEMNFKNYLNYEDTVGRSSGTAFVVDAENGYVVTNAHVAGTNPASYRLVFFNNEEIDAKLAFVDPWHDFAILKYNPEDLAFQPKTVVFGNYDELEEGDQVVLIGNSSGEGLSTKVGNLNKRFVQKGSNTLARHSHYLHVSLGRAGGASGSPVWNTKGQVIGIHAAGQDNESFELRIDYVVDALRQIQMGQFPKRGDLQFNLGAIAWSKAENFLHYPKKYVDEAPKENEDLHFVLVVGLLVPNSPADKLLRNGDVVVGIKSDRQTIPRIGYSLYDFDKFVDQHVGGKISLTIFRSTEENRVLDIELPVNDANESFARRYMTYAGGIFQDVTSSLQLLLGIKSQKGVFLVQASPSSPFNIGNDVKFEKSTPGRKFMLIEAINLSPVNNLDDFQNKIRKISSGEEFTITACNYYSVQRPTGCYFTKMENIEDGPLNMFLWNPSTLDWELEKPAN